VPVVGRFVSIHKSLGVLILILVAIRLFNRLLKPAPPLPANLSPSTS
jgi:cytochrome b561